MPRRNRRRDDVDHRLVFKLDRLARAGRLAPPAIPLGSPATAGSLTGAPVHGSPRAAAADAGPIVTAEPSGLLVARFRPIAPVDWPSE